MAKSTLKNSIKHPEAWQFYIEHARNMEEEDYPFKYRIPEPNLSGNFINANSVEMLWSKFIRFWYECQTGLNAPTLRGKIQYIVSNL